MLRDEWKDRLDSGRHRQLKETFDNLVGSVQWKIFGSNTMFVILKLVREGMFG